MRLFHKIALLALTVALVPLAVLGFSLIRAQRETMSTLLEEREVALGQASAERISRALSELSSRVQATVRLVDVAELHTVEEKTALMRAVYRLADDVVSVTWLRRAGAADGAISIEQVAPRVALDAAEAKAMPGRQGVGPEHLAVLTAAQTKLMGLPIQAREIVLGDPLSFLGRKLPSVLLMLCPDPVCDTRMVVEIGLRAAADALERVARDAGLKSALVGQDGRVLLRAGEGAPLGEQIDIAAIARAPEVSLGARSVRLLDVFGTTHLAAFVAVEESPFSLLVYQSEDSALALARAMQRRTLMGLAASALLSIVVGFVASRALRRRLGHYDAAARAIGSGKLDTRVVVDTDDELGLLGQTMNTMAVDLEKSRQEIEAFNRELQARVEARTAELRQAQARLIQAARLSAVGQLGAGVAHEIGNPLSRIIGYAQLMKVDPALGDDGRMAMDKIELAAKRVDDITKSLLRFSETQLLAPEELVSLSDCVNEAAALVRSQIEGVGITFTLALEEPPVVVRGQGSQLVQALFQLLDNAKNATPKGGTITVSTTAKPTPTLVVKDTGRGIAPEHLDKLFDPFFTTKTVWESPGLGLSLVYRIVENHAAQIKVESTLAGASGTTSGTPSGTEVRIVFPAPSATPAAKA